VREAAWPVLRNDLHLSYAQVGLLIGLPGVLSSLVEPVVGVLSDGPRRRMLVLGGGIAYAAALLATAAASGMPTMLLAMIVLYPASGAFVGLSEAVLIDLDPAGHERRMLAWTLAGGVGAAGGPLVLAVAVAAGGGWRAAFVAMAVAGVALVVGARRVPMRGADDGEDHDEDHHEGEDRVGGGASGGVVVGTRRALAALREPLVGRWLAVIQLTDLLGDVLLGYLALYLVDVAGTDPGEAVLGVSVWTGALLAGEALLLGPLRRVPGRRWLRASALGALVAFPAFLLVSGGRPGGVGGTALRLALLAAMGVLHAGWYALPKSWLFAALPGRSGTALALDSVTSFVGYLLPPGVGLLAVSFGLDRALWALLVAPVAVLALVPPVRKPR
jgi:FSR family fosmidomycin resistance protein-like MFS transporter